MSALKRLSHFFIQSVMKKILLWLIAFSFVACDSDTRFVLLNSDQTGIYFNNTVVDSDSLHVATHKMMLGTQLLRQQESASILSRVKDTAAAHCLILKSCSKSVSMVWWLG